MTAMDANAAFDAIQKIARSSKNPADLESMKARTRTVIDQFRVALSTKPPEERVLRQFLDGACRTKRVDEVETPVFMEALNRLLGKV